MRIVLVMMLLCLVPTAALAEFELAGYGGVSFRQKGDVSVQAQGVTLQLQDVSFNQSVTYGGKIGYWFPMDAIALGIGIDVFRFTPDVDSQIVFATLNGRAGTARLSPLSLSVVGIGFDVLKLRGQIERTEEFPNGQFQPYLTAGPAIFLSSMTDTNNFLPPNQKRDETSIGLKVSAGAQVLLTQAIGLFGEYRFTHFAADFGFPATVSHTFDTHHFVGGLAVHF